MLLYVPLQNVIQDLIGRQAVLVDLAQAKLRRGRLIQYRGGDNLFSLGSIEPSGQPVDHGLGNIGDDCEAAGHIPIDGAVAHRQFRLVARAQEDQAELIGEGHEQVAPDASLDVLLGHILLQALKWQSQLPLKGCHDLGYSQDHGSDPQIMRQKLCVLNAAAAGEGRGHEHTQHILGPQGGCGYGRHYAGVDPSGEAQKDSGKAAFGHIVPCSQDQGPTDLGLWGEIVLCYVSPAGFSLCLAPAQLAQVHHNLVLLEAAGPGGQAALAVKGHASAIEDQIVISPNLIDIEKGHVVLFSQLCKPGLPVLLLSHSKGRRREVDDGTGPRLRQLLHRIGMIATATPEIEIVPDILAYG